MEQARVYDIIPVAGGYELIDRAAGRTFGNYDSPAAAERAQAKVERGNPRPDRYLNRRAWQLAQRKWRKPESAPLSPPAVSLAQRRRAIRARAVVAMVMSVAGGE